MALSVKQWRLAKEISREELAEILEVHANTIKNWEENPESMPVGKAVKFAQFCDLKLEQIDIFCF